MLSFFEVKRIVKIVSHKTSLIPKTKSIFDQESLGKRFCLSMEVHPTDEKSDEKAVEKRNETYFDLYNPTGQFINTVYKIFGKVPHIFWRALGFQLFELEKSCRLRIYQ